jgi:dTDP-4-amino-4,6-dideoxygalactose transaminase
MSTSGAQTALPAQVGLAGSSQSSAGRRALRSWAAAEYGEIPYIYFGASGAALLFDALCQEGRRTIVLPAFICPTVSAMALKTGMRLVHVDVDRTTLHPDPGMLSQCMNGLDPSKTVLLLDHAFGYPVPAMGQWRQRYPGLLIVEDCVRALGAQTHGESVGHEGDWVLFSLYKNTLGNDHGAVLMTRTPYAIRGGPAPPATCWQWASGIGPLRLVYDALKRFRPEFMEERREMEAPSWSPAIGVPSRLCQLRFEKQLATLEDDQSKRCLAADAIQEALREVDSLQFVRRKPGCRAAAFFLSFTVAKGVRRDAILETLHRQGVFLIRAWSVVPAFYRCFATTFPHGATESVFLADHVCHIPLWRYLTTRRQRRLVRQLRKALSQRKSIFRPALDVIHNTDENRKGAPTRGIE